MGVFFWVAKISIFFGVLEIPDIFLGGTVDAGPKPTYTEKMRVPPWESDWVLKVLVPQCFREGLTGLCNLLVLCVFILLSATVSCYSHEKKTSKRSIAVTYTEQYF